MDCTSYLGKPRASKSSFSDELNHIPALPPVAGPCTVCQPPRAPSRARLAAFGRALPLLAVPPRPLCVTPCRLLPREVCHHPTILLPVFAEPCPPGYSLATCLCQRRPAAPKACPELTRRLVGAGALPYQRPRSRGTNMDCIALARCTHTPSRTRRCTGLADSTARKWIALRLRVAHTPPLHTGPDTAAPCC